MAQPDIVKIIQRCDTWGDVSSDKTGNLYVPVFFKNRADAEAFKVELMMVASERRAAREQYAKSQGGLCYWCHAPLDGAPADSEKRKTVRRDLFPPGFFKSPVHLQHNHKTGMTEGAVHAHCNAVMWQYYGR